MSDSSTLDAPPAELVQVLARSEQHERAGDLAGAIDGIKAGLAAHGRHSKALVRLAYLLDKVGADSEAAAIYEELIHMPHPPVNALMNQAVRFEDAGDFRRAERCLRRVLEVDPSNARARLYLRNVLGGVDSEVVQPVDAAAAARNPQLDIPVTDIDLSLRARNCLRKMNIRTLGDLVRVTEAELLAYRNFGDQSLDEVKRALSQKGLALGQGATEKRFQASSTDAYYIGLAAQVGQEVLETPLAGLSLSVRARRATAHLGIRSLGELAMCTEAELMGIKNFGTTSLDELRRLLVERGLSFRPLDG